MYRNQACLKPCLIWRYLAILLMSLLSACSQQTDSQPAPVKMVKVPGEVYLAPTSPKKAYIKTSRLQLSHYT